MSSTRASSERSAAVAMTPLARTSTPPGPGSMSPYPVATRPGSTPRILKLGSRDGLEDLVGDVVVRVHGLNVVQLLHRLNQAQHAVRVLALDPSRGLLYEVHQPLDNV